MLVRWVLRANGTLVIKGVSIKKRQVNNYRLVLGLRFDFLLSCVCTLTYRIYSRCMSPLALLGNQ